MKLSKRVMLRKGMRERIALAVQELRECGLDRFGMKVTKCLEFLSDVDRLDVATR